MWRTPSTGGVRVSGPAPPPSRAVGRGHGGGPPQDERATRAPLP
ncbi:CRISPR-associated protein Cas5 [Streptomyces xanthophaeus]